MTSTRRPWHTAWTTVFTVSAVLASWTGLARSAAQTRTGGDVFA